MTDQNESQTNIAERPSNDGKPEETILAGAPDGQPWADDSAGGKDLGSAAANAGYEDGGARGVSPDVGGFVDPGAPGTSDLGTSTGTNGGGNGSNNLSGVDPTRTIDGSAVPNPGNAGSSILEDDGEADQGGFKGAR